MTRSVLQLMNQYGGWALIDDGKPSLWFPERSSALETASIMASARSAFRGQPTCVQAQNEDGGAMEVVAVYE